MLGDIFEGAVQFGASYIGGKKRLERRDQAQSAYDRSLSDYFAQDTSNLYANMENTMEDLTVNTQAADFAAAQQAQNAQMASASIGQQEQRNQMLAAQETSRLQGLEIGGEAQSRALEAQLMSERAQIDAGELAQSEAQIQAARQARVQALGQFAGGVGNLAGGAIGLPTGIFSKEGDVPVREGAVYSWEKANQGQV